jgi:hypothetical protein
MATFPVLSQESTQTAPRAYLQYAEEELDPHLRAVHSRKSTLWKVAAVGTFVAFSILMVSAFMVSGFYLPIALPMIGISALVLLKPAKDLSDLFMSWSGAAKQRATQLHTIHKHYQALNGFTPQQLQGILASKGIHNVTGMQASDPQLTTLKPLIARHIFWEEQIANLNEIKAEKLKEAEKLSENNFVEHRERIYNLQSEALECEKQALESKVKTAFLNAVLRHPHFIGSLETIGTFSPASGQERAIAMQSNPADREKEVLFTFKNTSVKPLHCSEIKESTLTALALRIASAMYTPRGQ